jgi:hypothetical protein
MAYDEADKTIRAYEIKRGNGQFDAGKIRSIKRDLMCIQVLLRAMGKLRASLRPPLRRGSSSTTEDGPSPVLGPSSVTI